MWCSGRAAETAALLASQCPQISEKSAPSKLPSFANLVAAIGVPSARSTPPATARLPMRLVCGAVEAPFLVSDAERSLWAAYSANGVHELLSKELIIALAGRIKAAISCVELHGLEGRSDLNGKRALVIGPLAETGRVPVRVCSSGECVRARPVNVFEGDALPCVLEVGAGSGALAHFLAGALVGYAHVAACDDGSAFGTGRRRVATGTPPEHRLSHGDIQVQALSTEAALEALSPKVVVASWHPSGQDWTGLIRACPSVSAYLLLGEADSSTCGDAWATWGVLPMNWCDSTGLHTVPARAGACVRALHTVACVCTLCGTQVRVRPRRGLAAAVHERRLCAPGVRSRGELPDLPLRQPRGARFLDDRRFRAPERGRGAGGGKGGGGAGAGRGSRSGDA